MKYKIELPQIIIHRDKKIPPNWVKIVKEGILLNKKYFSLNKQFHIYICDNKKTFSKLSWLNSPKGASGCVRTDGNVVIRTPDEIAKMERGKKNQFKGVLIHEMNHAFWRQNIGKFKPVWLSEGIANFVADYFMWPKNYKYKPSDYGFTDKNLEFRYIEKRVWNDIVRKYYIWTAFTTYLIKKNGKTKLIKLLKELTKNNLKENYHKQFKKIFKKTEKEWFEKFLSEN